MKGRIGFMGAALALAGCASSPRPMVRQSAALSAGPRTISLAAPPPNATALSATDREAIGGALAQAGFTLKPTPAEARYLLVLTDAAGPRRVGSLLPPAEGAPKVPVQWVAKPSRGLGASFGPKVSARLNAILLDGATGRELWRATLAVPRRGPGGQTAALATRLLAELPRDQAAGGS